MNFRQLALPDTTCQQPQPTTPPRRTRPVFVRKKSQRIGFDTLLGALSPLKARESSSSDSDEDCKEDGLIKVERWPPAPQETDANPSYSCGSIPWQNYSMPWYNCYQQPPLFYGHGQGGYSPFGPCSNYGGRYDYDYNYPYYNRGRRLDGHGSEGWRGRPSRGRQDTYELGAHEHMKVHYCRRCGHFRSRRYHQENPLLPGRPSIAGLCGRCYYLEPRHNSHRHFPYRASGRILGEREYIEPVVRRHRTSRSRHPARRTSSSQHIAIHRYSSSAPSRTRSPVHHRPRHRSSASVTSVRISEERSGPPIGKPVAYISLDLILTLCQSEPILILEP